MRVLSLDHTPYGMGSYTTLRGHTRGYMSRDFSGLLTD